MEHADFPFLYGDQGCIQSVPSGPAVMPLTIRRTIAENVIESDLQKKRGGLS